MDSDGGRNPGYKKNTSDRFSSIAFENIDRVINQLLLEKGKFVVTFPLEYCNAEIDKSLHLKEYQLFNTSNINLWFLRKISELEWEEIQYDNYIKGKYKAKYPNVNFLCVMEIIK
jgi:hypothetical protein